MECKTIGQINEDIDDKDIGDFGCGSVIIQREFGNAVIQSDEPIPEIPEELGVDDHDTYKIFCFWGTVGGMWQGCTNVVLHRNTPLWEAVKAALGRKGFSDIGIWGLSEDRKQFSVCWKRELGCY